MRCSSCEVCIFILFLLYLINYVFNEFDLLLFFFFTGSQDVVGYIGKPLHSTLVFIDFEKMKSDC